MALIDDVRSKLQAAFPKAEIRLRRVLSQRVGGSVVWDGFDGQMQIDRQVALRGALSMLPRDQQARVSFILTLTPDEEAVLSET